MMTAVFFVQHYFTFVRLLVLSKSRDGYKTGAAVTGNLVSTKTNAPIVGINVFYVNGKPVTNIVTADNPTPTLPAVPPPYLGGNQSRFTNHRAIWRELTDEQK